MASSPALPSGKRLRQDPLDDTLSTTDFLESVRAKKHQKVSDIHTKAVDLAHDSISAFSLPTPDTAPRAYGITSDQVSQISRLNQISHLAFGKQTVHSLPNEYAYSNEAGGVQQQLALAHREIESLKKQLEVEVQGHEAAKLFLAQSIFHDMLRRDDKDRIQMQKMRKEKFFSDRFAREKAEECEQQKKLVDDEKAKHNRTVTQLSYYKNEVEHLESLNKIMQEDLDALRQVENEDTARRELDARGLPPAYGSLHDTDRFPTPPLQKDSGTYTVAELKDSIRRVFTMNLQNAQRRAAELKSGNEWGYCRATVDSLIFDEVSSNLAVSSRLLHRCLSKCMGVIYTSINSAFIDASTSMITPDQCGIASNSFVADRIAKMILDLTWRVISATEMHPSTLRLTSQQQSNMCLHYKEADDCLTDCLRQAFTASSRSGPSKNEVLFEYQCFLTQVNALRRELNGLNTGINYSFFVRAREWLEDRVEVERVGRANRPEICTTPIPEDVCQSPRSHVSSEMSGTDSDSSEDRIDAALLAMV